ncbi:hypothetical protein UVI_02020140 [Ustilaginoidea virens]|uniref:Uncharacterized protein n=1 Tax=Ustilaginoidea virens TaxID=1159556 RepID=A0A1B5L3U5_USTVR|nr:hypothetical protein UVI_02020140 [Ustilaginoidea virens]
MPRVRHRTCLSEMPYITIALSQSQRVPGRFLKPNAVPRHGREQSATAGEAFIGKGQGGAENVAQVGGSRRSSTAFGRGWGGCRTCARCGASGCLGGRSRGGCGGGCLPADELGGYHSAGGAAELGSVSDRLVDVILGTFVLQAARNAAEKFLVGADAGDVGGFAA